MTTALTRDELNALFDEAADRIAAEPVDVDLPDQPHFTVAETAALLGKSPVHAGFLARFGHLPSVEVNGELMVRAAGLREHMEKVARGAKLHEEFEAIRQRHCQPRLSDEALAQFDRQWSEERQDPESGVPSEDAERLGF